MRDLRGEHVDVLDLWRFGKQLGCLGHQRCRDLASQMCLAACVISKGIEDAKRCRPQPQCEPDRRSGFLIRQGESAFEKASDIRFFSWLGLQSY